MTRLKRYIKIFSLVGLVFALMLSVPFSVRYGMGPGIIAAIASAFLWTIGMAVLFIPFDYFFTRKLPPEAQSAYQVRELQIRGDFDRVFDICVDILKQYKATKKVQAEKSAYVISARTKTTFTSYGENILLKFREVNTGLVEIAISSHSGVSKLSLDAGKNFKNVDYIYNAIKEAV